jgi:sulfopyruvate decarboxylase TPP-binding subunit
VVSEALVAAGVTAAVGVPDSTLAQTLQQLTADGVSVLHVPREDVAVGMAVGSALVEERWIVFLKNAGLGATLDGLLSAATPASVAIALLIGNAGTGSDKVEHHVATGKATVPILEAAGVGVLEVNRGTTVDEISAFIEATFAQKAISAIVVPPG